MCSLSQAAASFILALRIRTDKLTRQPSPLVQQLNSIKVNKDTSKAERILQQQLQQHSQLPVGSVR
jgi:hypothetical protein